MSPRSTGLAPAVSLPREPLKLPRLPLPMHTAFWLQLARIIASSVPFVIRLATFNAASYGANAESEAARKHEPIYSAANYVGGFVFLMVAAAAMLAAWLVLVFLVRRGHNWARIVLTAGTALWLQSIFSGIDGNAVVVLVADLAVVVLVWLPTSSSYFRAARAARELRKSRQPVSLH